MSMPRGVQQRRVAGWRMPPNTVSVARPGPLGNPFKTSVYGQEQAVALHRQWLEAESATKLGYTGDAAEALDIARARVLDLLPGLRGKNLACFCPEPGPYERDCCHRAVLIEMANKSV